MDPKLHTRPIDVARSGTWRAWLPSRGNALLVMVAVVSLLIHEQRAAASPTPAPAVASTAVVPYQGRLTDAGGVPLDGGYAMTFKLYSVSSGGSPLWTETWSGGSNVVVTAGLFNVLLGSLTPISTTTFSANGSLWLGISVGADSEMMPRVQLGSAPFALNAATVEEHNVIANVQTVWLDANDINERSVSASTWTDILTTTVSTEYPAVLRISYSSTVYKTVTAGRTMLGIRIDGLPNTWVDNAGTLQVGTPVSASWFTNSEFLAGTFFTTVGAGVHTVALLLRSDDAGISHARGYTLNVEIFRQP